MKLNKNLTALIATVVFGVASTSLACPAKSGYMLNGTVRLSPQLSYLCGAGYNRLVQQIRADFKAAGKPLPANAWIEVYGKAGMDTGWINDYAVALTKYESKFNLQEAANYSLDNGRGSGGDVTMYKNYGTNKTLLNYVMFHSPTGNELYSYWILIGN